MSLPNENPRTQPDAYPDDNPKTERGLQKPAMDTIPSTALVHLGVVMGRGAEKYGSFNWREKTVSSSVYTGALRRHLAAWQDGEDIDPDSGASHLAHIMACAAILLDADEIGKLNDDRPSPAPTAAMIRRFEETGALR